MENLPIPKEVSQLIEDIDKFGPINDGTNWFITDERAIMFRAHLKKIMPLAIDGNAMAQCYVANLHHLGYLYSREQDAMDNYDANLAIATGWWIQAVKGGSFGALDILMCDGVGRECDRIRKVFKEQHDLFTHEAPPLDGWVKDMKLLSRMLYGDS